MIGEGVLTLTTGCAAFDCDGIVRLETGQREGQASGVKCSKCERTYTLYWKYGHEMYRESVTLENGTYATLGVHLPEGSRYKYVGMDAGNNLHFDPVDKCTCGWPDCNDCGRKNG